MTFSYKKNVLLGSDGAVTKARLLDLVLVGADVFASILNPQMSNNTSTAAVAIPGRPGETFSDMSQSVGGTLYGTTPGGTRIVYQRNMLLELRNSPLAVSSNAKIPNAISPDKQDSSRSGFGGRSPPDKRSFAESRSPPARSILGSSPPSRRLDPGAPVYVPKDKELNPSSPEFVPVPKDDEDMFNME